MKRDGSGKGFVFQAQGASFCLHFWCQGWSGSLHPPCRAGLGLFLPRLSNSQSCAPYRKNRTIGNIAFGLLGFHEAAALCPIIKNSETSSADTPAMKLVPLLKAARCLRSRF